MNIMLKFVCIEFPVKLEGFFLSLKTEILLTKSLSSHCLDKFLS